MRKGTGLIVVAMFCAAMLAVLSANAAGVTYYVDSVAGNDANAGTSTGAPWRTFANVNGRTFNAGDAILLKCGSVFTQGMTPGGSGTPAAPITVGSYGTGAKPIVNPGTTAHGIFLWNQSGWVIRDIEFVGGGIDKYAGPCGIYIDSSPNPVSYFRIYNVVCHGQWYGISIGAYRYGRGGELMHQPIGNDNAYVSDVIIDNAECYNNMGKGIHLAGNYSGGGPPQYPRNRDMIVRNCSFHDCGGDGIVVACTDNVLVENCIAHNCGFGENDRYGIWPWSSANVTVQFCEACHCATPANKGGGGFDLDYDCANVTVQYCYSHDNAGPACLLIGYGSTNTLENAVVRYLVSQNDVNHPANEGGAILPYGLVKNSFIYNNTIYFGTARENTAAIWGDTWGKFGSMTNTLFKNNIIYTTNGAYNVMMNYSTGGCTFDNNCYYAASGGVKIKWGKTNYTSVAAFRAATGQEANGIEADPRLNSPGTAGHGRLPLTQYQLQSMSPCINAGANIGLGDIRDYWGNTAPYNGVFDIGAHEYQGGGGGDTQPPTAPTNLVATAVSSSRIDLTWTASTDNVGVTGYKIFRGGVEIDTTTGTTYQDTGLSPNTTYSYYVKAFDAAGNISPQSNTAQATTHSSGGDTEPPTAPTNLAATAVSSSRIDLTWTASTDNVGVTGYQIFRNGQQVGTSGTTSYSDTGLQPNTTYTYYVKAYDAAGNVSPQSNTAQATTLPGGGGTVMHVHDIWTCDAGGNPQTVFAKGANFNWRVKIVDAGGAPVSGASVICHVAKPNGSGYDQGQTTGADGVAQFSKKTSGGDPLGTWTVEVTNVTKSGWTYDASANVKTSTEFIIQ
ncbi:MAG: right-handed parallel beta-helix repeat-containing protein [Patescibacteria group bacterium]